MKILVTGGAGFIGSHVVDLFLENGHQVVVVDNLSTGKKENINQKAIFYKVDIRDKDALFKVFEKEKIEVINHQAAHASVPESVKDPTYDADVNIIGSVNLAELAVEFKVKKFIFASTGGALYGDASQVPTSETYLAKPISPYGVAKLSFEQYLHYYHTVKDLKYTILRYSNVYGERQDPFGEAGVVAIFSQMLSDDKQPVIHGDGKQTRDFIYVKDVARASFLALKKEAINGAVNIGTAVETDINTLFSLILKASGKNFLEVHKDERSGEQKRSCLDFSKAKKLLGFDPEYVLGEESGEKSLLQTYQYFGKIR